MYALVKPLSFAIPDSRTVPLHFLRFLLFDISRARLCSPSPRLTPSPGLCQSFFVGAIRVQTPPHEQRTNTHSLLQLTPNVQQDRSVERCEAKVWLGRRRSRARLDSPRQDLCVSVCAQHHPITPDSGVAHHHHCSTRSDARQDDIRKVRAALVTCSCP